MMRGLKRRAEGPKKKSYRRRRSPANSRPSSPRRRRDPSRWPCPSCRWSPSSCRAGPWRRHGLTGVGDRERHWLALALAVSTPRPGSTLVCHVPSELGVVADANTSSVSFKRVALRPSRSSRWRFGPPNETASAELGAVLVGCAPLQRDGLRPPFDITQRAALRDPDVDVHGLDVAYRVATVTASAVPTFHSSTCGARRVTAAVREVHVLGAGARDDRRAL